MDEKIITEAFNKIIKQYTSANELYNSITNNGELSINICDKEPIDSYNKENDKQKILMRIKHVNRYLTFIKQHIDLVTDRVNDVPPYNVALEIIENNNSANEEWTTLTDEIYNTLNIDSDDEDHDMEEHDLDPADFFDNDSTPNEDIPEEYEDVDHVDDDNNSGTEITSKQIDSDISDDEELEVSEVEINNIKYYTTDEYCGKIYHILANDQIGKRVGFFTQGVADFY